MKSTKSTSTAKHNKATATASASKENAFRTAQPGIISHIMFVLIAARDKKKPVSFPEILASCSKKFPERPVGGMNTTVRAQLSRLPNERKFPIDKYAVESNARCVLYAAGVKAKANAPKVAAA